MKSGKTILKLSNSLWLNRKDNKFLGTERINLLEKIDELGSITKAAKAVGICYKTAWDTVSAINNLAEKPLVESLIGGKSGGGTCLTKEGKRVVAQFKYVQDEMNKYMLKLEEKLGEVKSLSSFLQRNTLNLTARNIFYGTISTIKKSYIDAEVVLTLKGGVELTCVVTNESVSRLKLDIGMEAYAIVKASSVIVGTDLHNHKFSTQNIFCGTVSRVIDGPVSSEVDVEIKGGTTISATITHTSVSGLDLKPGDHACALFKSSHVILGI